MSLTQESEPFCRNFQQAFTVLRRSRGDLSGTITVSVSVTIAIPVAGVEWGVAFILCPILVATAVFSTVPASTVFAKTASAATIIAVAIAISTGAATSTATVGSTIVASVSTVISAAVVFSTVVLVASFFSLLGTGAVGAPFIWCIATLRFNLFVCAIGGWFGSAGLLGAILRCDLWRAEWRRGLRILGGLGSRIGILLCRTLACRCACGCRFLSG